MSQVQTTKNQVIDTVYHARLLESLHEVVSVAGISKDQIFKSATEICGQEEIQWIVDFRKHRFADRRAGLCFTGAYHRMVPRMSALVAVLLRNYIDARLVTLNRLFDEEDSAAEEASALFVPNFYVSAEGKPLSAWQSQIVFDRLTNRFSRSQMSILFVQDFAMMGKHYGSAMRDFIQEEFDVLGA